MTNWYQSSQSLTCDSSFHPSAPHLYHFSIPSPQPYDSYLAQPPPSPEPPPQAPPPGPIWFSDQFQYHDHSPLPHPPNHDQQQWAPLSFHDPFSAPPPNSGHHPYPLFLGNFQPWEMVHDPPPSNPGPSMAVTTSKSSLQKQESMAKNFEQSSAQFEAMRHHITLLNQKVPTASEELTQRILEALEVFHRSEKEDPATSEVSVTTSNSISAPTNLDLSQPSPLSPTSLPQLQFGTATSFVTANSIHASVPNLATRPIFQNHNPDSTCPTSFNQSSSMVTLPEQLIRPTIVPVPGISTTKASPQAATFFCPSPQNLSNNNQPYSHSTQSIPIHTTSYGQPNISAQYSSAIPAIQDYSVLFSGSDPYGFIQGYEEFFKVNPMTEVDMIQYVMQVFEGEALEWYYQYVEGKFLDTWTPDCWEDFVIELYGRFAGDHQVFVERPETNQNQLKMQQGGDSFAFEIRDGKDLIDSEDGDHGDSQTTMSEPISAIVAVEDSLKHYGVDSIEEMGREEEGTVEAERNAQVVKRNELENSVTLLKDMVLTLQKEGENVAVSERKCGEGQKKENQMVMEMKVLVEENKKSLESLIDEKDFRTSKNSDNGNTCIAKDVYSNCYTNESDSEDIDEASCLENVLLVTGPDGTGKSATIYACVKEQVFQVVEVNASDWLNGALVKQRFSEAVESHWRQCSMQNLETSAIKHFFKSSIALCNATTAKGSENEVIEFVSLSDDEDTHNARMTPRKSVCKENRTVKTLILFEDVDATFYEDRSFLATIHQLAQTAKRPMILTSNSNDPVLPNNFDRLELCFTILSGQSYQKDREVQSAYGPVVFDPGTGHRILPKIIFCGYPSQLSEIVEKEITKILQGLKETSSLTEIVKVEELDDNDLLTHKIEPYSIETKKEPMLSRCCSDQDGNELAAQFDAAYEFSNSSGSPVAFGRRSVQSRIDTVLSLDSEEECFSDRFPADPGKLFEDIDNAVYPEVINKVPSHCTEMSFNSLIEQLVNSEAKKSGKKYYPCSITVYYSHVNGMCKSVDVSCVPKFSYASVLDFETTILKVIFISQKSNSSELPLEALLSFAQIERETSRPGQKSVDGVANGALGYDTTPLVFDPGGFETQLYMLSQTLKLTTKLSNGLNLKK